MPTFVHSSHFDVPAAQLFDWHARPGALERLIPPWQRLEVLERSGGIEDGARTVIQLRKGPLRLRWVAVHSDYQPGRRFVDEQAQGPFAYWRHEHIVGDEAGGRARLEDRIEYRLPLSPCSQPIFGGFVRRDLERTFRFRHRRLADDLARHASHPGASRLQVAVSGASGLIGRQLCALLSSGGHRVTRLVRRPAASEPDEIAWHPEAGVCDPQRLEGLDAVVHLAGRNIAAGRWSAAAKREIWESRVTGTRTLCEALARTRRPPAALVAASAIGYYGDRDEAVVDEDSAPGDGFLPRLCHAWEAATESARTAGIRVVNLRIGAVLTSSGGALRRMLTPFQLGLGGRLGDGRQFLSWLTLDDLLGIILHCVQAEQLSGPVNAVAPSPRRNDAFTRTLGKVMRRPTLSPLPAPLIRLAFGEMGQTLLLDGARVEPARLLAGGFRFYHTDLESALRWELGRPLEGHGGRS